jgi:glucose-6-phosphate 1-dehydrogenase
MPVTCTEIFVRLRKPPSVYSSASLAPNHVRFRISPEITLAIGVMTLTPTEEMSGQPVEMVASHCPPPGEPEAYERLLEEAMIGDPTMFAREDYVEEAWRIVDPVLKADTALCEYEPNTWGPSVVEQTVVPVGGWHNPEMSDVSCGDSPTAAA